MSIPTSIKLNFKNIRIIRQKHNILLVFNSIKDNEQSEFYNNINRNELARTLEELDLRIDTFWEKCRKDYLFAKISSCHLAKRASRQGSKDEDVQIRTCNFITKLCGVYITNLTTTCFRPTKDGHIVSKQDMKQNSITIDQCLKSFDAKVSGKIEGWISAKVAFGSGGHQDNVFEEMDGLAFWWSKYKNGSSQYLIILLDTDLVDKNTCIKNKYNTVENIKIFNHVEFQDYVISTFYEDNM
jgi:hypothetical protein